MQVRLGTYINAPPAACVAARAAQDDPRAEPAFGERVPYVVVCGAPSAHNFVAAVKPFLGPLRCLRARWLPPQGHRPGCDPDNWEQK